jgi:hypothetical protein
VFGFLCRVRRRRDRQSRVTLFFSTGAKGLSEVLAKVLKEKGRPIAYIRGEEFGGAVVVGLRITVSYMHFARTKTLNPP